jgi:hypothetical protein
MSQAATSASGIEPEPTENDTELLSAFRTHYYRFEQAVNEAKAVSADSNVLARLGDDLDEYSDLVTQVCAVILLYPAQIFLSLVLQHAAIFDSAELAVLQANLVTMRDEIRQQYGQALDSSHHGHPVLTEHVHTGRRGRPAIHIDPDFLRWAYSLRSTSSISRFLHVSRQRVRSALLEYGIAVPQADPFIHSRDSEVPDHVGTDDIGADTQASSAAQSATVDSDNLLNPDLPLPSAFPPDIPDQHTVSFTAPLSTLSDANLDDLILCLRRHYCRAGVTMLHGMLLRLGHRIPRERIRQSLLRIDPVQRVFERIRIRRRTYSVPGPNSLWHHDGQHGKKSVHFISNLILFYFRSYSMGDCHPRLY